MSKASVEISAAKLSHSSVAPKIEKNNEESAARRDPGGCRTAEQETGPTPSASREADVPVCVELVAPQEVANYLEENGASVMSNLQTTLSSLGYNAKILVQAGFNLDLAARGVEYEEVFIILEEDFLKLDDPDTSLVLLNCIRPYSGIVFTPSRAHTLPVLPRQNAEPARAAPSPILATYSAIISKPVDAPDQTVSAPTDAEASRVESCQGPPAGGENRDQHQKGDISHENQDNPHPVPAILTEESQPGTPADDASKAKLNRRRLDLQLRTQLSITSGVAASGQSQTGSDFTFTVQPRIKIEFSENENGEDCPFIYLIRDPWCTVDFASISMSSDTRNIYSLEEFQTLMHVTPITTRHYGLPTDNIQCSPGGGMLQRTLGRHSTREWHASLSAPVIGLNAGVNGSHQEGSSLQVADPRWNITSHVFDDLSKHAVVAKSKFQHTLSHRDMASDHIIAYTTYQGPRSIFSSKSNDDYTMKIGMKTFWCSINGSESSTPRPSSALQRLFQSPRPPPLFANFWYAVSFKLPFNRITFDYFYNKDSKPRYIIQRTPQGEAHPPLSSANIEVLVLNRSLRFDFPLQRTVVEALEDGRNRGARVESV